MSSVLKPEIPFSMTSTAVPRLNDTTGVPHIMDWFTIDGPASSVLGFKNKDAYLYNDTSLS